MCWGISSYLYMVEYCYLLGPSKPSCQQAPFLHFSVFSLYITLYTLHHLGERWPIRKDCVYMTNNPLMSCTCYKKLKKDSMSKVIMQVAF